MSEPHLGEIRQCGFNFAPRGWAFCDGQRLPISQYQSLYSLLGTTYGGDGRTDFALPDLRGRHPIHFDPAHPQGMRSGSETNAPSAVSEVTDVTLARGLTTQRQVQTVASPVNGQSVENRQPYLGVNYIIALRGVFPSRS